MLKTMESSDRSKATTEPIPFLDLAAQQARLKDGLDARIQKVLAHGQYIMGPEVAELETALCAYTGAKHCVTCANGTDAILLALMALGVGQGDAVFVPAFTFAATAEMIPYLGATPVFTDIDPLTFNMDAASLARCVAHARDRGLRPAAVIPVDLFGLPADYDAIGAVAADSSMRVIADSAQGFGSTYKGRRAGTLGDITTTSFFPAKPLGCYGDGGALFTNDDDWADLLRSMRFHGKGADKYDNVRLGMNSRLDTLQAAILLEKLTIFDEEMAARQALAERYSAALAGSVTVPHVPEGLSSAWAQYTVRLPEGADRSAVRDRLAGQGIPTNVYYPTPLHRLTAYQDNPRDPDGLRESEHAAATVLSLPAGAYLSSEMTTMIGRTLATSL